MDLEYNDALKEAIFSMKWQSLKSPVTKDDVQLPQKIKFVYKFFTYRARETDGCDLTLLNHEKKTDTKEKVPLKGAHYWLTHKPT